MFGQTTLDAVVAGIAGLAVAGGIAKVQSSVVRRRRGLAKAGLERVEDNISNEELKTFIASARKEVTAFAPWFLDPGVLKPALEGLSPKVQINIFLLDPDSVFASERANQVNGLAGYATARINESIKTFKEALATRTDSAYIRLVNTAPTIHFVIVDSKAYFGVYVHGALAINKPVFMVVEGGSLFDMIESEKNSLMNRSNTKQIFPPPSQAPNTVLSHTLIEGS